MVEKLKGMGTTHQLPSVYFSPKQPSIWCFSCLAMLCLSHHPGSISTSCMTNSSSHPTQLRHQLKFATITSYLCSQHITKGTAEACWEGWPPNTPCDNVSLSEAQEPSTDIIRVIFLMVILGHQLDYIFKTQAAGHICEELFLINLNWEDPPLTQIFG